MGSKSNARPAPIDPVLMLEDWGRLARVLGRIPTKADCNRNQKYTLGSMIRQFGEWSAIPAAFLAHAKQSSGWDDVLKFMQPPAPIAPPIVSEKPLFHTRRPAMPNHRARDGRYTDRPSCGVPLDLYGMRHAPANECGVVFLFGVLARRLGFLVESFQPAAFPDCEAKRMTAPGIWQTVRIEFEYESRNFHIHRHDPAQCDIIICWNHNWPECPAHLEVIALSNEIHRPPS